MFVEPKAPEAETKCSCDPTASARSTIRRAHSIRYRDGFPTTYGPGRRSSSRGDRLQRLESHIDSSNPFAPRLLQQARLRTDPADSFEGRALLAVRDADEAHTQASNRRRHESNRALLRDALSYERQPNLLDFDPIEGAFETPLSGDDPIPPTRVEREAAAAVARPPRTRNLANPTLVDGLGDRERSMSPDPSWEPLLTTIPPDHRLPSNDSSFTSANGSTPVSTSTLASLATDRSTPITTPSETEVPHVCDPCDESDQEYTETDTEADVEYDEDLDEEDFDGNLERQFERYYFGSREGDQPFAPRRRDRTWPRSRAHSVMRFPVPPQLQDQHRHHRYPHPSSSSSRRPGPPSARPPHSQNERHIRLHIPQLPPPAARTPAADSTTEVNDDARQREEEDQRMIASLAGGANDMQRILTWLSRRNEIPEQWWADAGLRRALDAASGDNPDRRTTRLLSQIDRLERTLQ
ncbi:MAG: hypothetical protein M4579_005556 [Chaenotheca gracillima]|nr:MAG: hypothetical protein M4579_005556 [Chaenotheca gracillima]